MLAWMRGTDSHPTASQIHDALLRDFPSLSLGTIYRNLEVLISDGAVTEVASGRGPSRYDGNPLPHHHFICDRCERIVDVDLAVPRSLEKRLQGEHGLRARGLSIDFFGLCPACEVRPGNERGAEGEDAFGRSTPV
jgi:Fur family peroxide stress response transcriptional regulator